MKKGKPNINKLRCSKKTQKNFTETSGKTNMEAKESPSMAEVEPFWKSL
jgi:hypothetical protein